MASINKLKSIFSKRDIARADHFKVNFDGLLRLPLNYNPEDLRELSYLVDSVNMPGRQLQTFGYDLFRHQTEYPTGYVNESFSIEFNMPGDMMPKKIFDDWINYVVDSESYLMKYADTFKCSMSILQTDMADNKTYLLELDEVFPKAIKGISYSQAAADLTKFGVEFAYNDIRIWDDYRTSQDGERAWPING